MKEHLAFLTQQHALYEVRSLRDVVINDFQPDSKVY